MNNTLEAFLSDNNPELLAAYKRLNTVNYYECGVLYNPVRSGFGTLGANKKKLRLEYCEVSDTNVFFTLVNADNEEEKYSVEAKELHLSLKRIDETVEYKRNLVNNRRKRVVVINDQKFDIQFLYWRNSSNGRVGGKVWVKSHSQPNMFWELYSLIGNGCCNLKTVTNFNRVGSEREQYDIKHGISVREFKSNVFGDPNIKINEVYPFPKTLNIW